MAYLVLARKYRPKTFEDVIGQEHVTLTLKNAIEKGRIHHAYIFSGTRGVGKTTTARILARALNCENGPTPVPCGNCPACIQITNGTTVDVLEIDGASHNSVDHIRQLRETVGYLPVQNRYKIYIIDEVHMLSISAFNALLKTLEEPPPKVIFIFATTELHKIPPTILSRCQKHYFKAIETNVISKKLNEIISQENIQIEQEAIYTIANQAYGSMRDALSIADQVIAYCEQPIKYDEVISLLGIPPQEAVIKIIDSILNHKEGEIFDLIDNYLKMGYNLLNLSNSILSNIRNLIVIKVVKNPDQFLDVSPQQAEMLKSLASGASLDQLKLMFSILSKTIDTIHRSEHPRYLLEVTLIKLSTLPDMMEIGKLLEKLENIEANLGSIKENKREIKIIKKEEINKPEIAVFSKPGPEVKAVKEVKEPKEDIEVKETKEIKEVKEEKVIGNQEQKSVIPSSNWQEILEDVSQRNQALGGLLSQVNFISLENGKLKLAIDNSFIINRLKQKKKNIEAVLNDIFKSQITIEVENKGYENSANDSKESKQKKTMAEIKHDKKIEILRHPIVKETLKIFEIDEKDVNIKINTKKESQ